MWGAGSGDRVMMRPRARRAFGIVGNSDLECINRSERHDVRRIRGDIQSSSPWSAAPFPFHSIVGYERHEGGRLERTLPSLELNHWKWKGVEGQ